MTLLPRQLTSGLARFWPLGPIFSMELRQMARRRRTYLLRFGYLGILLLILSMAAADQSSSARYQTQSLVAQAQRRAELGHVFLAIFAVFSVVAMHVIGPVLTSTAVGNERLRRTLDALLMTPLNAWQIVGGKLFSRTLTAFSLIGLTLPVLAIVRLLGGVQWEDLFGSVALAAATAIGSAAIGLLLSCFIRRAFAVILLSLLIQAALYFFLPMIFTVMLAASRSSGGSNSTYMTYMQVLAAFNPVVTAVFQALRSGFINVGWWPAVTVQLCMALLLMMAATRVIRREARTVRPSAAPTYLAPAELPPPVLMSSGPTPPPLPALMAEVHAAAHPPERRAVIHDNPVLWREIRRPMLARKWQRVVATTLCLGMLGLSYMAFFSANALHERSLQLGYAFTMTTVLQLIAVVLASTAIATEKESDTWTTLIASPLSGPAIVWGKFRGVIRKLRWPFILVIAHFSLFTIGGVINFPALTVILWTTAVFGLPWIATGLYFSLRCTRPTTAVVLNLLMPFAAYAVVPMVLVAIESVVVPYYHADSSELVLYYLPFFYQDVAIERLANPHSYGGVFSLPMRGGTEPAYLIVPLALIVGLILIGITAILLALLARRFDHIVGRAKKGEVAMEVMLIDVTP